MLTTQVEDVLRRREVRVFFGSKAFEEGKKKAVEYAEQGTFKRSKIIFSDNFDADAPGMIVIELHRKRALMDRPMAVGFTVLEMSKWWMFHIHYDMVKEHFQERARLLYTDTDSLTYRIESEDWIADQKAFNDNYNGILEGAKLGNLKDELFGLRVKGFIALRPKMYCFGYFEEDKPRKEWKIKHKGVPEKSVGAYSNQQLKYENFWRVWQGEPGEPMSFHTLRPSVVEGDRTWSIRTLKMTKRGLANTDDKSHWFDGEHCSRYGHWRVRECDPEVTGWEKIWDRLWW